MAASSAEEKLEASTVFEPEHARVFMVQMACMTKDGRRSW